MKKIITTTILLAAFISCKKEVKPAVSAKDTLTTKIEETIVATGYNSRNSLDWEGVYKGVTPCADCEGIEIEITLNKDLTYKKTTQYLGVKDSQSTTAEGKFTWNSDGINITLQGLENEPSQYLVGENKLFQLDMSGKRITGTLAEKYVLRK